MPHTRSAKKNMRKSEKRRLRNRTVKKAIKLQIRKVLSVAKGGAAEELQKEIKVTIRKLDKAAARRVIHKNTAARKKSQLARLYNRRSSATTASARG